MNVQLTLRGKGWQEFEGIWIRGRILYAGRALTPQELKVVLERSVVDGLVDLELLKPTIRRFKGFYSIIWALPSHTLLIADIVRTYPVFFTVSNDRFVVSDSLPVKPGLKEDVGNVLEFALTGFVTGSETIWEDTFQVQAGEAVLLHHESGKIERILHSFWGPLHPNIVKGVHEAKEFLTRLDRALSLATERLITYLDGRAAVIPLSGGWDSRTILLHLKRQGYPRVLAFSYGKERNPESVVSAEVARQLGVKWVFVPYRVDDWRALAETPEYWDYMMYAHNGVSAPHIQDMLAVRQMVRCGIVASGDAVVIPGHSADFVAGSHLRREYGLIREMGDLIKAIFTKHYVLMPPKVVSAYVPKLIEPTELEKSLRRVYEKIADQIKEYYRKIPFADPYALLDFWNWRERQAKFIVNAVRVYEFFGLDFWLPLWDTDFVNFWEGVPLEWRLDRALYREYLVWLQAEMGVNAPVTIPKRRAKQLIKLTLQKVGLMATLEEVRASVARSRLLREYDTHPLQWYGVWDRTSFSALASQAKGQINVNTLVVLDVLRRLYRSV